MLRPAAGVGSKGSSKYFGVRSGPGLVGGGRNWRAVYRCKATKRDFHLGMFGSEEAAAAAVTRRARMGAGEQAMGT